MQTLDLLKQTASTPLYEELQFSEFHSSLTGSLRVRINPSRAMVRQMQAARAQSDTNAYLELTAQLIPRERHSDEPLTRAELETFLEGEDTDDTTFGAWLTQEIWERVGKHFLAVKAHSPN